jgi:uncharacterized protein YecE (DUF72 family)
MWMPKPTNWFAKIDPITADFTYVRWLGACKGMEEWVTVWNHTMIDRRRELSEWVQVLKGVHRRGIQILGFANNHYAGDAPGTIEEFRSLWNKANRDEDQTIKPSPETEPSIE